MAGGSSVGSSARTNVSNNNMSMYQDDSKMYAAVKMYTNLEDTSHDGNDAKLDVETLGKA